MQVFQNVNGYGRDMSLIEVTFTCGLCDHEVIEWVYPGAPPSICADCVEKRGSRNAARAALWRKRNPEAYNEARRRQRANRKASESDDTD